MFRQQVRTAYERKHVASSLDYLFNSRDAFIFLPGERMEKPCNSRKPADCGATKIDSLSINHYSTREGTDGAGEAWNYLDLHKHALTTREIEVWILLVSEKLLEGAVNSHGCIVFVTD